MAQKARMVLAVLAFVLPALAAQAGETRDRHQPIVLNGRLHTGDFSGGVGYGAGGGTYYVQGWSYGAAASGSSSFARSSAFASAAARASAFSGGRGH